MVQNNEANMYQQCKLQTYVNNGDEVRKMEVDDDWSSLS
jgi:hypothetical protein